MSIPILRKIRIFLVAFSDSRGPYGSYLKDWQPQDPTDTTLNLSAFMSQLVIGYSQKCTKKLSRTRSFKKLYTKILEQCDILDEQLRQQQEKSKALTEEIGEIDVEITNLQSMLKNYEKSWIIANETGSLPTGLGVLTASDLRARMSNTESYITELSEKRNRLSEELGVMQAETNKNSQEIYSQLTNLTLSYRDRINKLYGQLEAFAGRQDEALVYYWHLLCVNLRKESTLSIYRQAKSFAEICQLRNVKLIEQDEIFRGERDVINRRTSNYTNFEITI